MTLVAIFIALVFLLSLVSGRLERIRLAVMVTVRLSIFAHGLSALPGMDIYARKISALPPSAAELESSPAEIRDLMANPNHHSYG